MRRLTNDVAVAASLSQAVQVFTTLRTVIHNASRPFASLQRRQVRLGNPAFHSRVGRFPGALDVLLSAGFHRAEEPLVPRGWETMPENEEQRRTDEDEEETGDDDWMVMAHVDSAAVWIVDCVLSAVLERLVAARGMGLPTRA